MPIRDEEYWKERLLLLESQEFDSTIDYYELIKEAYDLAQQEINDSINKYLLVIANNNKVSLADARVLLDNRSLREFRYTLKKFEKVAKLSKVDKSWVKKLDNASARVNINRLEALNISIEQSIQVASAKRATITTNAVSDVLKDSYLKNTFEIQKGTGYFGPFSNLNEDRIDAILKKPWAPDGSNFSAKIWKDRDVLVNQLQQDLTQQLISGQDISNLFEVYEERFGVTRKQAERLIRTESTFFAGQGRLESYKESGVKVYEYLAVIDSRTSDICNNLNGKRFRVSEAQAGINYPSMHPYCRSTSIPIIEFDDAEEYIDSIGVERRELPASYGFKKWSDSVGADTNKPKVSVPPAVYPKRVVQE